MPLSPAAVLLVPALILCSETPAGMIGSRVDTRTESVPFGECIALVREVSEELGVAPVNILRTQDVWLTRLDAVDGALMITCSRPDNRLTFGKYRRS
jgi:hypothetical protein